jgi:uncharacterized protein involved in exopolysaccharide biosynthesis
MGDGVSGIGRRTRATLRASSGNAIDVSRQEHENACREIAQLSTRLARLESEIRRLNFQLASLEHVPQRQTTE